MNRLKSDHGCEWAANGAGVDDEIVEMSLLLPGWQVAALESAARDLGLTTGQMVRRVIRQFVNDISGSGYQPAYSFDQDE